MNEDFYKMKEHCLHDFDPEIKDNFYEELNEKVTRFLESKNAELHYIKLVDIENYFEQVKKFIDDNIYVLNDIKKCLLKHWRIIIYHINLSLSLSIRVK